MSRSLLTMICLSLLTTLPSVAGADQLATLAQRRGLLQGHRARLEQMLNEQVARIGRLKAQPTGVRRDFQLNTALRENRELASKLTRLQDQMRELNHQLLTTYEQALSRSSTGGAERLRLQARRDELAKQLAAGRTTRIVTKGKAELLDDPEDLEEKADLLKDSEAKLRQQLVRVQNQISRLTLRSKLKRHGRGIDDSLFVEDSPRRTARAQAKAAPQAATVEGARAPKANEADTLDTAGGGGTPAPPPTGAYNGVDPSSKSGSTTPLSPSPGEAPAGDPSPSRGSSAPGSELSISVRGVLDPSTLNELRKADRSGSVAERVAALKKARQRLQEMADRLGAQAKVLRQRARSRRPGG